MDGLYLLTETRTTDCAIESCKTSVYAATDKFLAEQHYQKIFDEIRILTYTGQNTFIHECGYSVDYFRPENKANWPTQGIVCLYKDNDSELTDDFISEMIDRTRNRTIDAITIYTYVKLSNTISDYDIVETQYYCGTKGRSISLQKGNFKQTCRLI